MISTSWHQLSNYGKFSQHNRASHLATASLPTACQSEGLCSPGIPANPVATLRYRSHWEETLGSPVSPEIPKVALVILRNMTALAKGNRD
jgi:hypothetical protein